MTPNSNTLSFFFGVFASFAVYGISNIFDSYHSFIENYNKIINYDGKFVKMKKIQIDQSVKIKNKKSDLIITFHDDRLFRKDECISYFIRCLYILRSDGILEAIRSHNKNVSSGIFQNNIGYLIESVTGKKSNVNTRIIFEVYIGNGEWRETDDFIERIKSEFHYSIDDIQIIFMR